METSVRFPDPSIALVDVAIPHFYSPRAQAPALRSPRIQLPESLWVVQVFPRYRNPVGLVGEFENLVSIGVKGIVSHEAKGFSADVKITLLHSLTNAAVPNFSVRKYLVSQASDGQEHVRGLSADFCIDHDSLWGSDPQSFFRADLLKFRVEIKVGNGELPTVAIEPSLSSRNSLQKIYESDVGRDFILISSDGTELNVHKAILNAASPVFERMFQANLKEGQTGRCDIEDVSTDTLNILVRYMYCGSLKDLEKHVKDVLVAADKYELEELKKACEDMLKTRIEIGNVAELLFLANTVSAADLKQGVMDFILKNGAELKKKGVADEIVDIAIKNGRFDLVKEIFALALGTR